MAKLEKHRTRRGKAAAASADMIGTAEAAEELGISQATLRRWVTEGRMEGVKVGKQWRFARNGLRRVVTVQTQQTLTASGPVAKREVKKCEETLDRLLRARGVKGHKPAAEVNRVLKELQGDVPDEATTRVLVKLVILAVKDDCSDLHIEPYEEDVKVRERVDGALTELMNLPRGVHAAMVRELKRWSNLNIAEQLRPQDGRITMDLLDRRVDLLLNVMPSVFGEVVAVRILDRSVILPPLDRLGFEPDQLERWRQLLRRPRGLILVNGPAGCGKTTVIYASLLELAKSQVKIVTAEDPVEYPIPGVTHAHIRPDMGVGYAAMTRSMLRQAPNVMFIGELRDREVGELVCQAALTGHLVFSQLHTSDAIQTVVRLIEMGVEPHIVASGLEAVTAQRLVRLVCSECKTAYQPARRDLDALGVPDGSRGGKFYRGRGCAKCRQTGYRGRAAVIELLEVNRDIREAIFHQELDRLPEIARAAGWRPMREVALDKVIRGETTVEEVVMQTAFSNTLL